MFDGNGEPVTDAALELWQVVPGGVSLPMTGGDDGRSGFTGFTRVLTSSGGRYGITTLRPSPVELGSGVVEAPHLAVSVLARGLLQRAVTYVYFDDEVEANSRDPLLSSLDEATRRGLLAVTEGDGYRFDIDLQGEEETPFFVP